MGLHQIKKFLHSEETINKNKRQPTKWEMITSDDIFDMWFNRLVWLAANQKVGGLNSPREAFL